MNDHVRNQFQMLTRTFDRDQLPDLRDLRAEVKVYLRKNYDHEYVSDRALVSYVRHRYTDYKHILSGMDEGLEFNRFYHYGKAYVACLTIEYYGLRITPLLAIYPGAERIPLRWWRDTRDNLFAVARRCEHELRLTANPVFSDNRGGR